MIQNPELIPSWPEIVDIFEDCFARAEHTFGPREPGYHYSLRLREYPPYPQTINLGNCQILVWLTEDRSWIGYYFEAAHEVIHCLNPPDPNQVATFLEEAVAACFGSSVVRKLFPRDPHIKNKVYRYEIAMGLAAKLDSDIIKLGQRLRQHSGALRDVTCADIEQLHPCAEQSIITSLLEKFPAP